MSSLCHDDLVMGSLSEWGLFLALFLVMILGLGFEVLVMMFTVIRGRIDSHAGLELSCSLFGCAGLGDSLGGR